MTVKKREGVTSGRRLGLTDITALGASGGSDAVDAKRRMQRGRRHLK